MAGLNAVAAVAEQSLRAMAKKQQGTTAKLSHMAGLAADALATAAVGQGIGKAEIDLDDLDVILGALREMRDLGHVAYLRAHGTPGDCQAIGRKTSKRLPALQEVHRKAARRRKAWRRGESGNDA
jgi:hypothetical protein